MWWLLHILWLLTFSVTIKSNDGITVNRARIFKDFTQVELLLNYPSLTLLGRDFSDVIASTLVAEVNGNTASLRIRHDDAHSARCYNEHTNRSVDCKVVDLPNRLFFVDGAVRILSEHHVSFVNNPLETRVGIEIDAAYHSRPPYILTFAHTGTVWQQSNDVNFLSYAKVAVLTSYAYIKNSMDFAYNPQSTQLIVNRVKPPFIDGDNSGVSKIQTDHLSTGPFRKEGLSYYKSHYAKATICPSDEIRTRSATITPIFVQRLPYDIISLARVKLEFGPMTVGNFLTVYRMNFLPNTTLPTSNTLVKQDGQIFDCQIMPTLLAISSGHRYYDFIIEQSVAGLSFTRQVIPVNAESSDDKTQASYASNVLLIQVLVNNTLPLRHSNIILQEFTNQGRIIGIESVNETAFPLPPYTLNPEGTDVNFEFDLEPLSGLQFAYFVHRG